MSASDPTATDPGLGARVDAAAVDAAKDAAGRAAVRLVEPGMRLGLGTGSTVDRFLVALAAEGLDVAGVPTSRATEQRCQELGIRLLSPDEVDVLDLVVDGADELTRDLVLTKGGGGALLREKVVATMGERFAVIATSDKLVPRLGEVFAVPVEVVPFALGPVSRELVREGLEVTVRGRSGAVGATAGPTDLRTHYLTDNGNAILDVRAEGGMLDPEQVDVWLTMLPGVVTSGIFVDLATDALLGRPDGTVETLTRPDR
jgi:ribose 5-phosphate isomerase A